MAGKAGVSAAWMAPVSNRAAEDQRTADGVFRRKLEDIRGKLVAGFGLVATGGDLGRSGREEVAKRGCFEGVSDFVSVSI